MSKLFERLLEKRGLGQEFLLPKYEDCADVGQLPDMDKAVERIGQAVRQGEKVLIYGDYDVDGVTASTVMYDALRLAGVKEIGVMLPDRFRDGYGMSERLVERVRDKGFELVVTVDCGSNNAEIVAELAGLGVDTVVTDHHECIRGLPEAVAVVNPKRSDAKCGDLSELAGVGVAFMVARGLVQAGLIPDGQEKWLLDLVTIGTICDSMRMRGENRRLCYWGMKVLAKTRRVGLQELARVAGVKRWNSDAIGFQLGPRLNAAGRMASAEVALKLLMTTSRVEAAKLAEQLEVLNNERKNQQRAAVREICQKGVGNEPVIVAQGDWHEGVLGIIAGRLVEEFKRPAFVLGSGEVCKGSGRSFGDFNLAQALSECQKCIVAGGGHAGACGVKVLMVNLEQFKTEVNRYYRSLNLVDQERYLERHEDLSLENVGELTLQLVDELSGLEPYGEGNAEPVWLLARVWVAEATKMGAEQNHLRLLVRGKDGKTMKLVAFYASSDWLRIQTGDRVNVWVTVTDNEWNGLRNVEGRIIKIGVVE